MVGKTQIALEYVQRLGSDYDTLWCILADRLAQQSHNCPNFHSHHRARPPWATPT
ncbi:hypothetical protein ABZ327_39480 [Streptomyces sp. NPDC006135]|uniref:hypothetical protein n=1 Tax=Streptomyces sp. NPDC006135 TaxID=3154577 RepID=UPI0033C2B043